MLLLNIASEEVQDIFAALVDTGATYDEVVAALNAQPLRMECGCQSGRGIENYCICNSPQEKPLHYHLQKNTEEGGVKSFG